MGISPSTTRSQVCPVVSNSRTFCVYPLNLRFIRSKGQKIKLVIAACLWNNPQVCPFSNTAAPQSAQRRQKICVLDEPSNFLDREALGGLAVAIRDWTGAVVHLHFPVNNSLQLFI